MNVYTDPVNEHYFEMNDMREIALEELKSRKEFYDLEDMAQITMEAYAKQYNRIQDAYDGEESEVYICREKCGEYKLLTLEENLAYLDEAFERLARGVVFLAASRERYASVRHQLYGEPEISAPENYQNIIPEAMLKAKEAFMKKVAEGRYNTVEQMAEDAKALASKFLKEDSEFWLEMRYLFFNTKPLG